MKKNILLILSLSSLFIFLFISCNFATSLHDNNKKLYKEIILKLESFQQTYISWTQTDKMNEKENDPNKYSKHINSEEKIIYGQSAEGGKIIKYTDANDNLLRYELYSFGEAGKSILNYYVLNSESVFISELNIFYDTVSFSYPKNDFYYHLNKYVIIKEEVYVFDEFNETIINIENKESLQIKLSLNEIENIFATAQP